MLEYELNCQSILMLCNQIMAMECPEVVQLVHHFLLPAYFVALEKSINLEGLVLKLNAVNSLT